MPQKILTYDLEANSLRLDSKLHCIGVKSGSDPTKIYTSHYMADSDGNLTKAKEILMQGDLLVGFNNEGFDQMVLNYQWGVQLPKQLDLLLVAKLVFTKEELTAIDAGIARMPKDLWGKYSLKAFGYRFYDNKLQFEQWERLTSDMMTYCIQDVDLTYKIYEFFIAHPRFPVQKVLDLEHRVGYILAKQERAGFHFNIEKAQALNQKLIVERFNIERELAKVFRPRYLKDGEEKVTKKAAGNNSRMYLPNPEFRTYLDISDLAPQPVQWTYYQNGKIKFPKRPAKWHTEPMRIVNNITIGAYQPIKLTKFNPGSRAHIQSWLKDLYGWEPVDFTTTGNAKVDADTLEKLPYPESAPLKRYLKLVKDIGQLSGTDNSLMKKYDPDMQSIHGRCDHLATVTRRAAHSSPNLGQVPKAKEFRELFDVPEGWRFVGADASALELKILAHYLYPYDGGAYNEGIDNGDKDANPPTDVHSMAQKAMGLPTRDAAKTATYGILYGSSATRVGWGLLTDPDEVVEYTQSEYDKQEKRIRKRIKIIDGKEFFPISKDTLIPFTKRLVEQSIYGDRVVTGFKANLKGFKEMMQDLESRMVDGYIESIDGGWLPVRSKHSLLNLVLQSTGSIAVKYWMVEADRRLEASSLVEGEDYQQMAYVHDELDFRVREEHAETVGQTLSDAMAVVPKQLGLNVGLEADYIIGHDWYECH